jgi:prophage maintenance system killer protein
VFLRLNGIEPKADGPEWEDLTLDVAASGIDREATDICENREGFSDQ